jgi:hypothetical protein
MANFDEIDEARRLLGLGEAATLKKLNRAYKALMDYCTDYKYSFKEADVAMIYPYEEQMRKWRENWFGSI